MKGDEHGLAPGGGSISRVVVAQQRRVQKHLRHDMEPDYCNLKDRV